MSVPEPKGPRRSSWKGDGSKNPYTNRWGWWYSVIADQMLDNPGITTKEIALALNKGESTIAAIRSTDMFREYFARRKAMLQESHDFRLREKMVKVADEGLDLITEKLRTQKSQIPMALLNEVTTGVLDRLGFSTDKSPGVQVNVQQNDNRMQIAVDASALEEARQALRASQHRRAIQGDFDHLLPRPPDVDSGGSGEGEAVEKSDAARLTGGDGGASGEGGD